MSLDSIKVLHLYHNDLISKIKKPTEVSFPYHFQSNKLKFRITHLNQI